MMNRYLMEEICAYTPYNEQEERDRELILHCLETEDDLFTRENRLCHLTASAWVVNKDRTKVLMAYHNIYNSWSWLGGHADGDEDLMRAALREVREEAGISSVRALSEKIFSLEVLTVDGHIKNGAYVSSHLHLNVTYLLEADENEPLHHREGENTDVRWFPLDEAVKASSEPWFREHVYSKLNEKLAAFGGKIEQG